MATLFYQGHGSFRLETAQGKVIYVDPFAGEGYDKPADLILVTHDHYDHNCIDKPARAPGCALITWKEALEGGALRPVHSGGHSGAGRARRKQKP